MIISRTPLRVSFVGGGSDLPAYYEKFGGAVLSTTINKYIYITVNKKFDHKFRISYSTTEMVEKRDEIKHELVREGLKELDIDGGVEITSISDIPSSGTGLGSSSTYTVGLLHALSAYKNRYVSAQYLAQKACEVEIVKNKRLIGKQDQYAAAYGGLNVFEFDHDGEVKVTPVICEKKTREELEASLLMLYTGVTRSASGILENQSQASNKNTDTQKKLKQMVELVYEMKKCLEANDLEKFGEILHRNWELKRGLMNGISNNQIDDWYERGRKAGALGGKLLGAGGGGFLLLFAPPKFHSKIKKELKELEPMEFKFDRTGSKIIFYDD